MFHLPGSLLGANKRRLLAWTLAGLTFLGLVLALVWFAILPAVAIGRAQAALRGNDPAGALPRLERYLARWPNDSGALLLAAQAARRSDGCADAERFLSASEQGSGPTDASRLEWALLGAQQGDFAGNEKRLQSDVDSNHPGAPLILEAIAKGYDASFRWPEALAALDQLFARVRDHVPGLLLRARIQSRMRRLDKAEVDLRRAVDRAPESAQAHAALANVHQSLGHTREALYHFGAAQRYGSGDATTLLGIARALIDAAELDQAQDRLDDLLAADPNHVEALVERGRLALRRGKPAEAEPFLARASREAPWHREGHQLHLAALKELGRSEEARRCEDRLAALKAEDAIGGPLKLRARNTPADVDVRWRLWLWSERNGLLDEGFAWLTEILSRDPRHSQAHTALAEHFGKVGQPRRAALHRAAASDERAGTGEKRP